MFLGEIGSEVNGSRSRQKKGGVIYTVGIIYICTRRSERPEVATADRQIVDL